MLINKTKNKLLAKTPKTCISVLSKAVGLMFKKPKTLIFIFEREKIIPLHMLFVFYPIDVLFVNQSKKVVETKKNFRPFTFYTPKHKAKFIIELPAKTIQKTNTKVGDTVKFT
jgi:uncharacterized membrane protein (UPF0127 family)